MKILLEYWWQALIVGVVCAFWGGINYSLLISKLLKKTDIRHHGSGNPGTTNMFRVFGLKLGALTFLCDMLKGLIPCLLCKWIFSSYGTEASNALTYLAGYCSVQGHIFPIHLKFRGGKGVATSIGVVFAVQPILMLCSLLPMILLILLTDRMSVMSLIYAAFMVVWCWVVEYKHIGLLCCILFTAMYALLIFAHRKNIVRLIKGKELPTGVRKSLRGKHETLVK